MISLDVSCYLQLSGTWSLADLKMGAYWQPASLSNVTIFAGSGKPWPESLDQITFPSSVVISKAPVLGLPWAFPETSTSEKLFSIAWATALNLPKYPQEVQYSMWTLVIVVIFLCE
mmetsp:Transcript_8563/g.11835  ORF Transcript_8563/g.11835 Transcript_8563/m.11835 type:complete len:116 (+) Transcript_8563:143-490(+)